ncbi:MAG: hypothetical protein EOS79_31240 [Mesorhizobium sp.]|nr:MAG: hypothetical protein EOS79_31240 [Mesorhizobium sp.]
MDNDYYSSLGGFTFNVSWPRQAARSRGEVLGLQFLRHAIPSGVRNWRGSRAQQAVPHEAEGKDERKVGYVKKKANFGRRFENWAAFEAHLDRWKREVADQGKHHRRCARGTFAAEARALRPISGRPLLGNCST